MKRYLGLAVLVAVVCACGATTTSPDEADSQLEQREAWNQNDSPSVFGSGLEYRLDALPSQGEAASIPWPGSAWVTFQDSINVRWAGPTSDSPSLKYEKAFGGRNVEDLVSLHHGIDSASWRKACQQRSECDPALGETCAIRPGRTQGHCIPRWWGICHGWAPAAILWPEPQHPVTRNGVTFEIADLKALASLVHHNTSTRFVSLRCNETASKLTYDAYGRPSGPSASCRDTNPGTYHLLLTNFLGLRKQSFVEDLSFDMEVWNQPLRGYNILEQRPLTSTEANELIGVPALEGGTTVNLSGAVTAGELALQAPVPVTEGERVSILVRGTGKATLLARMGGAPTPFFFDCMIEGPAYRQICSLLVPAGVTELYVAVQGGNAPATFQIAVTHGGQVTPVYQFNANATSFQYVRLDVSFIYEAADNANLPLLSSIDWYTRTQQYEYVLELDAAGRIVGGEWVGFSKTFHPDFLWLPLGASAPSVAGGAITHANVKSLMMEAGQP